MLENPEPVLVLPGQGMVTGWACGMGDSVVTRNLACRARVSHGKAYASGMGAGVEGRGGGLLHVVYATFSRRTGGAARRGGE